MVTFQVANFHFIVLNMARVSCTVPTHHGQILLVIIHLRYNLSQTKHRCSKIYTFTSNCSPYPPICSVKMSSLSSFCQFLSVFNPSPCQACQWSFNVGGICELGPHPVPVQQFNNPVTRYRKHLCLMTSAFLQHLNVTADVQRAILISVLLLFNHTVVFHISFFKERKQFESFN